MSKLNSVASQSSSLTAHSS